MTSPLKYFSGKEGNFNKRRPTDIELLGTPYDYSSIMHYSAYGFAEDRAIPTIIPLNVDARIRSRGIMSEMDIERVQVFYECLGLVSKLTL